MALRLLDADRTEIHRYDMRLPYRPPPNPLFTTRVVGARPLAARPWRPTAEPNLMLVTAAIPDRMERGTQELESRGGRRVRRIGFVNFVMTASVRNTTTTRWGYPARVQFHVSLGTPETGLRPIGGEERSDGSADVPGNIEPGGLRDLTVTLPWAGHMQRGLWHTLSVWIVSSTDAGDADNGFRVVFMYDADGRLVAQRSMVDPRAGLTATVRR
jgi:YD repeat-containing protein